MSEEQANGQASVTDEASYKLTVANAYIERQDKQMAILRQQVDQYLKDLQFFRTSTGSEYAYRRFAEVSKALEEIEKL